MAYSLRGRIDSRLVSALGPAVAAAILALAIHRWWPVEIAALMVGVGVVLDLLVWDRAFDYQPAWAALPIGAVELGVVIALTHVVHVRAPLGPAVAYFWCAWLLAQLLGHIVYPWTRLSYADDGGELGRTGASAATAVALLFVAAGAVGFATRPPVVTLDAGVHQGPIVITHEEVLKGKPGAVVRGGILVRASGVVIKDLTVLGGTNGIDVESAKRVRIENVRVVGAQLDGIHVRFGTVMVEGCSIVSSGPFTQGIDISYSLTDGMSSVTGCDVSGGSEGIVTHDSMVMVGGNRIHGTGLRGITMTEMSMGEVKENNVAGARGVGIYCGDHSECEIGKNIVAGTRSDHTGNLAQAGVGIELNYYAFAYLDRNVLVGNPKPVSIFDNSRITRQRDELSNS